MNFIHMLRLCLFLTISLLSKPIMGQEADWCRQVTGEEYEYGVQVDTDSNGNIYSVGYSTGVLNILENEINPNGRGDAYITKHDVNGNILWYKTFGGKDNSYYDTIDDVHVDINDNVYILMTVKGDNYLYDGISIPEISGPGREGGKGVILKINPDGDLLWWENDGIQRFEGIDSDTNGDIYVTGYLYGRGTIAGTTLINNTAGSTSDMFIAKLTSSGVLIWAKNVGGTVHNSSAFGLDISLDETDDNVYVTGRLSKDIYFETATLTGKVFSSAYFAKYSADGTELWAKILFNDEARIPATIEVSSTGVIGVTAYDAPYGLSYNCFIGLFNSDGSPINIKYGYSGEESKMYGFSFNEKGEYYVSSHFENEITIDDITYTNNVYGDIIFKFNSSHEVQWVYEISGATGSQSNLLATEKGVLYIGRIDDDIFCNDNQGTIVTNNGDAILMKVLDGSSTLSTENVTLNKKDYLFPNPTKGKFQINSKDANLQHLRILDQSGRILMEKSVNNGIFEMDISDFNYGVYFVIATFKNEQQYIGKIFKQ